MRSSKRTRSSSPDESPSDQLLRDKQCKQMKPGVGKGGARELKIANANAVNEMNDVNAQCKDQANFVKSPGKINKGKSVAILSKDKKPRGVYEQLKLKNQMNPR